MSCAVVIFGLLLFIMCIFLVVTIPLLCFNFILKAYEAYKHKLYIECLLNVIGLAIVLFFLAGAFYND